MPHPRRARLIAVSSAFALAAGLLFTARPAAADPEPPADPAPPGRYIVTLKGSPIATYGGEVKGLRPTRPATGRKVDVRSRSAEAYAAYLEREQNRTAARVGAKADEHYAVALNGFSAELTPAQATRLEKAPGVLSVVKDLPRRMTDDRNSVDFLRLTGRTGVWQRLGGAKSAGAGTVVGVLDSGYWPESRSFAGAELGTKRPTASNRYRPYRKGKQIRMRKSDGNTFTGVCQAGANRAADFRGNECNEKVVGARYYAEGYLAGVGAAKRTDYLSPRDRDGHGSHTASTAVGNAGVPASVNGRSLGRISGVAPAAKLAVYKVCWASGPSFGGGCFGTDILKAVNQAVADGVDVINFSIGGSDSVLDPTEIAFFNAAAAGIFVAASAGNSGPGPSTLAHPSPWLTTVAASTVAPHTGTVVLGDGRKYFGISTTVFGSVGGAPLVSAERLRTAAASAVDAAACLAGTLDPAKTRGKIVVCDRGLNGRVDKSVEVQRAGGIGMVLVNLTDNSRDPDTHAVPTVHLNAPESLTVKTYSTSVGATATLRAGNLTSTGIVHPQIAEFSSRGPSLGSGGDLVKPDLAAPGVAVLAAVSPDTANGDRAGFLSGTSMSAPHVAGAAALYFGKKPTWSPVAVKSAMMTTSIRLRNADGSLNRDYDAQGAGNLRPSRMFDPGLILNSGPRDWARFVEGATGIDLDGVSPIDPSDFNAPSIAIGELVGRQTITRTVTAVERGTFRAEIGVPGITATVSPSVLRFTKPGQQKTIKVTFTQDTAALGQVTFGSLRLTSAGSSVRLPIAITPQAVDAPDVLAGTGASGSVTYRVRPGSSGAFPITARGLDEAAVAHGSVSASVRDDADEYPVTIDPGTRIARWNIESDAADADIDLEVLQVVDGGLVPVGASGGGTGVESVTLSDPEPGDYRVVVYPFADPEGRTATAYEYQGFAVGSDLDNLSVTPANPTAQLSTPFAVTAAWTGLDGTKPYLGWIEYPNESGTLVEIN